MIDHRALGFGTLARSDYADLLRTANDDVSGQRVNLIRRVVDVVDGATLSDVAPFSSDAE